MHTDDNVRLLSKFANAAVEAGQKRKEESKEETEIPEFIKGKKEKGRGKASTWYEGHTPGMMFNCS